jgi:hypothetical protein
MFRNASNSIISQDFAQDLNKYCYPSWKIATDFEFSWNCSETCTLTRWQSTPVFVGLAGHAMYFLMDVNECP